MLLYMEGERRLRRNVTIWRASPALYIRADVAERVRYARYAAPAAALLLSNKRAAAMSRYARYGAASRRYIFAVYMPYANATSAKCHTASYARSSAILWRGGRATPPLSCHMRAKMSRLRHEARRRYARHCHSPRDSSRYAVTERCRAALRAARDAI